MPMPPTPYQAIRKRYRAVVEAYERLSAVCHESGPLPPKVRALVKLALALGARMEGAAHAHTRLALEAGWPPSAIRHVALLATTTLGFPTMMACHSLVEDVLAGGGRAALLRPQPASPKGSRRRRRRG